MNEGFSSEERQREYRKQLLQDIKELKESRRKQNIAIKIGIICALLGFLFNIALLIYGWYSGEIY